MVTWNLAFKLGLAGAIVGISLLVWFISRALADEAVPVLWVVGLALLFVVSVLTCLGSQISQLSFGGPE
jgi:hypothetical protein